MKARPQSPVTTGTLHIGRWISDVRLTLYGFERVGRTTLAERIGDP